MRTLNYETSKETPTACTVVSVPLQMVLIVTQPHVWYKGIDPVSFTKAQYRQDLKLIQLYTLQIDKVF